MFWIFGSIVLLVIALVAHLVAGAMKSEGDDPLGARIVMIAAIAILVFFTFFMAFTRVESGHVKVQYGIGKDIKGSFQEGASFRAPWTSVRDQNVQQQKESFDLAVASKEVQEVKALLTVIYRVDSARVEDLYRDTGPDWFNRLIPNRVQQAFKEEVVEYRTETIPANRDKIKLGALARLRAALEGDPVTIVDINIENLSFAPGFTKAIEEKQIAEQNAQKAANEVKVAEQQANARIAEAQGKAKANELLDRTLTDKILQDKAIEKFNENVEIVLVPSGNGLLLDPSSFLKQNTGKD